MTEGRFFKNEESGTAFPCLPSCFRTFWTSCIWCRCVPGRFPWQAILQIEPKEKMQKWAKCYNFARFASFLPAYNLCPSWEQVRINFCSNWAEVGLGTSAQFGRRCISFYSQLGNNFAHILWALQIGKQCKPVQVYSFSWFPLWVNLRKLLVGEASPIPFERHLWCRLRIHSEYFYLLTSAQFA